MSGPAPPGGLYWLASYPKSGNTWFRVFLSSLLRDGEPVRLDELDDSVLASDRSLFDDLAGVESSDLLPGEIEALRPRVYERLRQAAEESGEVTFHKIHDAYVATPGGRPLVPPGVARGTLYFLRNPLDVAVSWAAFAGTDVNAAIRALGDENHALCCQRRRLRDQLRQRLRSWSGHVTSWLDAPELRTHLVRYEDMSRDPVATFTGAARFAGLPAGRRRVLRALEHSRFDALRRQEERRGFEETSARARAFFREGKVGSWRRVLSAAQAARLIADHGRVMRRFGYLDASGEPIF